MKNTIGELYNKRDAVIVAKQKQPYIFQFFNVSSHYSNIGICDGINKMLTPMVEALNEKKRLPSYILVILDVAIESNQLHSQQA